MKKIIALLLALAMIFAFAACKGKDDNKDTTADSTQGAGAVSYTHLTLPTT